MSGDLFGSCINGNPCPKTCLPENYQDPTYPQFGNTIPEFTTNSTTNNPTNSQRTIYGGLLNSRRIKQYASMHILAKGSLATVNTTPNKTTIGQFIQTGISDSSPPPSYTNVGGPGDQDKSVPLGITGFVRGNKARVYSMPGKHDGVDVKHNSYNRYLLRKKGIALRCSNC
tara:strand:- start:1561 stop:2073 length:513 start_codon:yes stop_codon:yes gene_type:complete